MELKGTIVAAELDYTNQLHPKLRFEVDPEALSPDEITQLGLTLRAGGEIRIIGRIRDEA